MSKKCVKKGENPNIPYPKCERSIKISVFKQQCFPYTGTKIAENGGNRGKIQGGGDLPGDKFDGDTFTGGKISPPPGIVKLQTHCYFSTGCG